MRHASMLTGVRVCVPHASHDVFLGRLPRADESPRVGTVPGANGVGGAAAASGDQNGFHASARNLRRKWMKASKCVVRSLALQFTDRQHRSGQARENQHSRSDCADKFKDGGVYRGRTPHTRYVRHMSTTRELLANIWPTALDSTYPEYDGGAPSSAAALVCGGLVGGVQGVQVTRLVFARGERGRTVVNFAVVLPRAWSTRAWSGSAGGAGCINFVQHAKKSGGGTVA